MHVQGARRANKENICSLAVLLALAAVLTAPNAAELFGGFSLSGLAGGVSFFKNFIVQCVTEVLEPVMCNVLPPALILSFQDEKMAASMCAMMDHLMANPKFLEVLKKFIKTSMTDEHLLGSLKAVMQEALSDSDLYKSAMHGVAHSLNPLHSETLGKMFSRKSKVDTGGSSPSNEQH
ncbi:Beta-ketoacyl-[acyl-carrier-protein] synthase I [Durusdinium trenchii]|uniref:Beta-ketoacyl-[acyl-carrier-protein] synthase I n=1 Tax=Durusdinium trenchii TaxID=1381693 RepID=A0ABP0JV79_9DINO